MRRTLTIAGQFLAAVLLILIGLGTSGCQDTASVNKEGQLASLSVTGSVSPGGLDPAFSSDITSYTVDVSTADTSVTVRATPQDSGTTMTINGQETSAGQARTIALPQPTTNIIIVLTAPSQNQHTYVVIVRKVNNDLSALSVTPGSLSPSFAPGTLNYTTDVDADVTTVTVSATKADPNAVMSGSVSAAAGSATGQAAIPLGQPGSSTVVSITVTASNGIAKTYRITVSRVNNNLSALSVTPGVLVPAFAQSTLNYTVTVGSSIDSVTVSATKADPNAVMSGSVSAAAGSATGQAAITLGGQGTSTAVSITVTAPNGDSKTYGITVNRATPGSENALSALNVTPGRLIPAFAPGIPIYTVTVGAGIDSVTVSATKADPSAVMSGSVVAGAGIATGRAAIPLNGPGTITVASITVTAPNGNPRTYTITIDRGFR
ncbi:MAG: cadherin-like beta sandwich domain-containing protein [Nitrospira sp. BO4]|jgi:hypothetical protein|nr:cadherin-like beta sandwich domain-containing protein [Nitrospira sp. BO4]